MGRLNKTISVFSHNVNITVSRNGYSFNSLDKADTQSLKHLLNTEINRIV